MVGCSVVMWKNVCVCRKYILKVSRSDEVSCKQLTVKYVKTKKKEKESYLSCAHQTLGRFESEDFP